MGRTWQCSGLLASYLAIILVVEDRLKDHGFLIHIYIFKKCSLKQNNNILVLH